MFGIDLDMEFGCILVCVLFIVSDVWLLNVGIGKFKDLIFDKFLFCGVLFIVRDLGFVGLLKVVFF